MKVTVDITREDFWHLNKYAMLHLNKYKGYVIAYMVIIPIILFVAFQVLDMELVYSAVSAVVLGVLLDIYFFVRLKSKIMKLPEKKSGLLGEHIIELSEDGIKESTDVNESFSKWDGVHSVKRDKSHFYIFLNSMAGHIIPRRSFVSEDEAEQFYKKAVEWLDSKAR